MKDALDDLIAAMAAAPTDRSLDGMEAEIGRDIASRRRDARTLKALAPVRILAVGLALAIGATAGSAASMAALRASHPAGPFAAATELAPSTLLEGAG